MSRSGSEEFERAIQRARIRDVLEAYCYALDSGNLEVLAGCFSRDVEAVYRQGTPEERHYTGVDELVKQLSHSIAGSEMRTHTSSSIHIVLRDGTATAVSHATATIVRGKRITVRGLRYDDSLILGEDGWRISRRAHVPLWQYEVERGNPVGSRPNGIERN
jgi:hypothetical protein